MARQKIVVKVAMHCEKKARKALQVVVSICGVESAAFEGPDKDQIVVIGEGIDSVKLTAKLRKCVGHTDLVSVGLEEEKNKDEDESKPTMEFYPYQYYGCYGAPLPCYSAPTPCYGYMMATSTPTWETFGRRKHEIKGRYRLEKDFYTESSSFFVGAVYYWVSVDSSKSADSGKCCLRFSLGNTVARATVVFVYQEQKIMVKVAIPCEKKARKALQVVVSICGVESAAFEGPDKDQIAVIGEGIDPVKLTAKLRKCVGYTDLVNVGLVVEEKEEEKKDDEKKEDEKEDKDESKPTMEFCPYQYYGCYSAPVPWYGAPVPWYDAPVPCYGPPAPCYGYMM
ncbi:hypothetical protein OSB04_006016 [Centaurea solstitialis]|uniref:HMA domain-containing protein n=1 Tax=Centaurea solstitialis TaxID=347529 RepID=A0AA38WSF1_9ASTR|nr:hypothetical protein OSB04_006016 [Centaurea solstitialis]